LGWDYQGFGDESLRRNRFPLMRPVQYERTAALRETAGLEGHKGMALTINVESGGMCLLMDWEPDIQDVLRVHVPMPVMLAKTPTLAEVRWKRHVPLGRNGLYFVGMKFVL
jgi:hypothetical protein